ncbi:DNA-binding transcriptional regulator SoxS [Sebaldella termitidis]|uniref:Transcriptional regulator, AraC family n=1 Tax=Sebaldella termitidis (strain ATCC 33386 / NCTC 11300) TaxID=526218 RepID=D1AJR4_SEBTE|nr:AraC family transcriptional regulator [Sebaldella termitidis]ACZ06971.1 transcriptional regulator, AraC family [Sebaldella termitidis ATCC 33386]SUI22261.1 DNA-binding transcriptional regulator SoxS [Sebaldella termitidis]
MDNTKRVNMVLDYIEQQLCHELDEEAVSRIACCSFQQFLRIFSYMTGISLHEYIRRRKLSAAAEELVKNRRNILDTAVSYGYDTHSGFSRAFKMHHNATPTEIIEGIKEPQLFERLFFLSPSSAENKTYRIEKGDLKMAKLTNIGFKSFGPYRLIGRAVDTKLMSNDIAMLWGKFFADGSFHSLLDLCRNKENLTELPDGVAGIMHNFGEGGSIRYLAGIIFSSAAEVPEGFDSFELPAGIIAESQITGEEYEIYSQGHELTVSAIESSGYIIDRENFYQCEAYTDERFSNPKKDGETILTLDYYIPVLEKKK